VLIDLGARLGLPGFVEEDGSPAYPGGYADYMVNHERKPGIGPLSGWRGADGTETGVGAPNPDQLKRYIENGGFHAGDRAREAPISSTPIAAYLDWAIEKGIRCRAEPYDLPALFEPLRKFRLAARATGIASRPSIAGADRDLFRPAALLVSALRGRDGRRATSFPLHAITQRPAAHVSFLGLAECVAAADPRRERALCPIAMFATAHRGRGRRLGWVASPIGEIRVPGAADGRGERHTTSGPGTPSASARAPGR
jgi:hypothetical protein